MSNRLHGLYRAIVTGNVDPEARSRLKTMCPDLGVALPWALACLPCTPHGIPGVGATVWLMFEGGNVEHPVWMGVLPGTMVPPPDAAERDPGDDGT